MLADRGIPRSLAGWCVEPKLDGWRVRVLVDAPGVRVMTRGGMDRRKTHAMRRQREASLDVGAVRSMMARRSLTLKGFVR